MEAIIGIILLIFIIIWAIRIETNMYKIVDHLKNIEEALQHNKEKK